MEIYLQEVLVATFVKLEPSVRAKLEKLAQGVAGVLEAVVDFWRHGVPTKTWHLLRGVTGHDAGDAGDGWQNLFGDGLNGHLSIIESTAWLKKEERLII